MICLYRKISERQKNKGTMPISLKDRQTTCAGDSRNYVPERRLEDLFCFSLSNLGRENNEWRRENDKLLQVRDGYRLEGTRKTLFKEKHEENSNNQPISECIQSKNSNQTVNCIGMPHSHNVSLTSKVNGLPCFNSALQCLCV